MRPILNEVLKNTEMVISYVLTPDKYVFPHDILRMGNEVLKGQDISR